MSASYSTATPPGPAAPPATRRIKVVVATSVMLSFISFWRAAAIVLNDLGSSAFYAGGIAEQAVGTAAPWFILGVMLFSYAVRAVYVESCAMFTRGGVYRVVKEAMGGTLAKLSVSALMFDYILTGPISGVSAGQYIISLIAQTSTYFGLPWHPSKETINLLAAGIAILITAYFWWRNTKGIHESSEDSLKIMLVVTVMAVIMIAWSVTTIVMNPEAQRLPPSPTPKNLFFNKDAVGWLPSLVPHGLVELPSSAKPALSAAPEIPHENHFGIAPGAGSILGLIGILVAFGHSVLAMSGEESLAQVNRELEYPKHKNLMKAGLVIFLYSLFFTSLVSFFAYAIIPDAVRPQYYDNLISGIAMYLVGPTPLKLLFQGFIVIVGFLMLAGAVNTAIIGSNGVLNRVSEDGVMTDWFRQPHHRFGTTYRMINMIVILQLITIIGSRGNVYTLGEAYAFGVIWSFAFKALAMFLLRFKDKKTREWKVPFNLKIDGWEIPIGLGVIATLLFMIAGINLITKQVATISGITFTLIFFATFWISERINEKRRGETAHVEMDQFKIITKAELTVSKYIRPGNILCLVRDYHTLEHLRRTLEVVDTNKRDVVVLTIRRLSGPDTGYEGIHQNELFTNYEQLLFSKVVSLAEKLGKHVELLVVPSSQVFQAIAMVATQLESTEIISGRSSVMSPEEQARLLGQAWEQTVSKPDHPVIFRIIEAGGKSSIYTLGAHAPELTALDVSLIHQLWLEITQKPEYAEIHHRDVVTLALTQLKVDLEGTQRDLILGKIQGAPLSPSKEPEIHH